MNLTTARFTKRAKEVGLRKVVGARRRQIMLQFLGESFFISLSAIFFAFIISLFTIPFFNEIADKEFSVYNIFQFETLISFIVLFVFVGFISGIYPAFYLSKLQPGIILGKERSCNSGGAKLRKILVIGQFTISITLLLGTFIVYSQLNFMKSKDLGFDKEEKLLLSWGNNSTLVKKHKTIKTEFLQLPNVSGATVSSGIPGSEIFGWQLRKVGATDNKQQFFNFCLVDDDFIPEYKIKMSAGRAFVKERISDIDGPLIINEAAVKSLGWHSPKEALGKKLRGGPANGQIIGIMKDFHFDDLKTQIAPLVMVYSPKHFYNITLTIGKKNRAETILRIKKKWLEFNPGGLFSYTFVDSIFNKFYHSNEKIGKMFCVFTFLGIFISCLGLLGLVSYTAERKKKEIGLRKTLGASITNIVIMLSKEYIKLVLISTAIALPIGLYLMNSWLLGFAYKMSIDIWILLSPAFIAIIIVLLTVCFHSIKAASANPVISLRSES